MNLTYVDGIELLKKAYEKVTEDKLFSRWIANYEREISFQEFKEKLTTTTTFTDKRSESEILIGVKEIIDTFNNNKEVR